QLVSDADAFVVSDIPDFKLRLTANFRSSLRNEQSECALKLGAFGQFVAVSLGLPHKVCQSVGGQRLT
ncbi:MAG TPA: hypothetical protein VHN11_20085, partial [Xanthobacteraceae bacterium]|nr:hypothetical protein [Xanthobacteraceae bacterium]